MYYFQIQRAFREKNFRRSYYKLGDNHHNRKFVENEQEVKENNEKNGKEKKRKNKQF